MRFLETFLDSIFPPRESEMCVRLLDARALVPLCKPRLMHADLKIVSLLPYQAADVQACVLETKFYGNGRAAERLGEVLGLYLQTIISDTSSIILIPLPLSPARLRERGYNQSERILRAAIPYIGTNIDIGLAIDTHILLRTRNTHPQTSLSGAERRKNMHGAFAVTKPLDSNHTYIVVDDVFTTGSTLSAALAALHDAGGRHISGIAVAH